MPVGRCFRICARSRTRLLFTIVSKVSPGASKRQAGRLCYFTCHVSVGIRGSAGGMPMRYIKTAAQQEKYLPGVDSMLRASLELERIILDYGKALGISASLTP